MPRRPHARAGPRPPLRVVLLMLTLCAVVALAPARPGPPDAGVALAAAGAVSVLSKPAIASGAVPAVPPNVKAQPSIRDPKAPLEETLLAAPVPSRPVISVPEPEGGVAAGAPAGSTAVFLGDSFTSGWNGAGLGARGWPRLVGDDQGWRTVNLAVAGTGFINPGWTNQPIGSRVAEAIRRDPDVVVIAGGHNDSRWSASATARAADAVIDRLHAATPDALFVIVAPIWQDGSPPQRCLALRDHLRRKAAAIGAVFIDPLADGWFSGTSHRLIGSDALHPTDGGHRFIADHVLAALADG